jgi:hypothetical protein
VLRFLKEGMLLRGERVRKDLIGSSRPCLRVAQADECASEVKECLVEVRSPLVMHQESSVPCQAIESSLT